MKLTIAALALFGIQGIMLTYPLTYKSSTFEWCVEKEAKRWAGSKLSTDDVARIAWDACPTEWAAARRAAANTMPIASDPRHVEEALRDFEAGYRKTVRGIVEKVRANASRSEGGH